MPDDVVVLTHIPSISKHHLEVVVHLLETGAPIGVYIQLS
jgi:hypothetical protein